MKENTRLKVNMIAVTATAVFAAVSLLAGIDPMYLAALCPWILCVTYACNNLKKRIVYLVFLLTFFIFLLGGHFCYEYFGMEINYYFSNEIYFHSNLALWLSLIFVITGVFVAERFIKARRDSTKIRSEGRTLRIRKLSKWFFFISCPFWYYVVIDKIIFVARNSYFSYYTDFESSAPFVVVSIASMAPFFALLYLATLPSKKECLPVMLLYLGYGAATIFTGKRMDFVVVILILLVYVIYRHFRKDGEVWIKKKYVIAAAVVVPVLVIVLQIRQFAREGGSAEGMNAGELVLGFFRQQGFSSSTIRLEKYYEENLRSDTFYSLFGIVKYFRTNSILKLIFNPSYGFSYSGNTAELAQLGNSMASALSYQALGKMYLNGHGVGTSYIAELYHDLGYFGVAAGSALYGIVMSLICRIWHKKSSPFLIAAGFSLVEAFAKTPRWNYDIFVTYGLDLGMWMAFILVAVLSCFSLGEVRCQVSNEA